MSGHPASPLRRPATPVLPSPGAPVDRRDAAESEFRLLAAKIARETTFPCESYKPQVLRRRIAVRMRARGVDSYPEYARVLDADRHEYARLIDVLTVNVTRFFRDAPTYDALANLVVPRLWTECGDSIAVWSAGVASGEEAYSLAALFHEEARRRDELHRLGRVRVLGTDIDRASLLAAARAQYPPSAFREAPSELLDRLFPRTDDTCAGGTRAVATRVRAVVDIQRRDLLRDAPPPGQFDLIACRNVIIYLDRAAQEQLVATLHASLRPGGYLVLGRAEMLLGPARLRFTPVLPRERIFRRNEASYRVPAGATHG
jgi:chemotaxis methyl-accepting protein methylase